MYKSILEFLAPIATAWEPDRIDILFGSFFRFEIVVCESNPLFAALTASPDSLN